MTDDDLPDDDLNNVSASPDDVSYECGWHDGTDYGYRLAAGEPCPHCGRMRDESC
jgi:hypothetical protein